jgi:iron complex outermembrane receptor protein
MIVRFKTFSTKGLHYSTAIASLLAMGMPTSHAQEADQTAQLDVEQITVTGSRIVRDGYEAPTPVSVLGADELNVMAVTNISEAVNRMPAFTNSLTTENSSAADMTGGVQNLNLRGINPNRTLVLLDGKRLVGTTFAGFNNNGGAVDINAIPNGLISRIDVVTGGASAVYGSDALAGVVNFVMDREFTGLKGDVTGGITSRGDGEQYKISLTGGVPFANGRGHFLAFGEHTFNDGVTNGFPNPDHARGWSEASPTIVANPAYAVGNGQPRWIIANETGFAFGTRGGLILSDDVNGTNSPLRGIMFGPGGTPLPFDFGTVYGAAHSGGDWQVSRINQDPVLASKLKRFNVYLRGDYDVMDNVNVYAELGWSYTDSLSVSGVPQFQFGGINILSGNPFIPESVQAAMDANGISSITLGSTNADLPQFGANNNRIVRRYALGAEGDFNAFDTNWSWEASWAKSTNHASVRTLGTYIGFRKTEAQDAVLDPNTGAIVCRSTLTDPTNGCKPWNPFGIGVNDQAAVDYVSRPNYSLIMLAQDVFSASASGEPLSTWAGPVSLAFGVEHRIEKGESIASQLDQQRAFFAGNFTETTGKYSVTEGFIETVVPLAMDQPWAESLDLNGAVRFTDYSTSGYVTTWKVGATYSPVSDITFRATRSRDIRAPGLGELFIAGRSGTGQVLDPSNGVSSVIVTRIEGNPNLLPEKANTTGVGVVYQPAWLPGFGASVDFYNIDIGGAIVSLSAQNYVDRCFEGETAICSFILLIKNNELIPI